MLVFTRKKKTKNRSKGAMLIEYALILCFILIIGSLITSPSGISSSIGSIFTSTSKVLDNAAPKDLSPVDKMKLFSMDMKEAIDNALVKAGIWDGKGVPTIDRGVNYDSNQKNNETVQALDKYIREYLKEKGINAPVDSMYWSIGRSEKGEPNTIRFGWSPYDIKSYTEGSYIPMIQYTYYDTGKYREYQVCEKQVQNGNTINWTLTSKNVVHYGDDKDKAIDAFVSKYMSNK